MLYWSHHREAEGHRTEPRKEANSIMTSMDHVDAVRLAMSTHFLHKARRVSEAIPTEDDLRRLQETGPEWEDLVDDLVRAAHPFVAEDGSWRRVIDGQAITGTIGLDDVLAAARYAKTQAEAAEHGDYALGRAVNDALRAAAASILAESADALHQALDAERGLL